MSIPTNKTSFMDLPPELRLMIYASLPDFARDDDFTDVDDPFDSTTMLAITPTAPWTPPIARTSAVIRRECLPLLAANRSFDFQLEPHKPIANWHRVQHFFAILGPKAAAQVRHWRISYHWHDREGMVEGEEDIGFCFDFPRCEDEQHPQYWAFSMGSTLFPDQLKVSPGHSRRANWLIFDTIQNRVERRAPGDGMRKSDILYFLTGILILLSDPFFEKTRSEREDMMPNWDRLTAAMEAWRGNDVDDFETEGEGRALRRFVINAPAGVPKA